MNVRDILDWDESADPAAAPAKALLAPWRMLGTSDRQLLDALAEGIWVPEDVLRRLMKWGRLQFLIVTTKMVVFGWVEARPTNSFLRSEYRLSPKVWT